MSTPTDQQQIRATLRRAAQVAGDEAAAFLAITEAIRLFGGPPVSRAIDGVSALHPTIRTPAMSSLPPIMGAAEAADVLGMKATNLKRLSPPLPVAAVISGRVPVYLVADVMAAKERREARRATA